MEVEHELSLLPETLATWSKAHLPPFMLRLGPYHIYIWQWLGLCFLIVLAYCFARALGAVVRRILFQLVSLTPTKFDDLLVERATMPVNFFLTIVFARSFLPILELQAHVHRQIATVLGTFILFSLFWLLDRSAATTYEAAHELTWVKTRPNAAPVLLLTTRLTRVVIWGLAIVMILQQLGYPVTGLLAGFGIGGLAVALGAQKTLENVLASVVLSLDQPFRMGDFIKVDEVSGQVESMGLRSTRIRTLERTLVTMPNGKLADARIESFAVRDKFRFVVPLSLQYGSSSENVARVLAELKQVMLVQENVDKASVVLSLQNFTMSALDIEVTAYVRTGNFDQFRIVREKLLLQFIEVLERNQMTLAVPLKPFLMK